MPGPLSGLFLEAGRLLTKSLWTAAASAARRRFHWQQRFPGASGRAILSQSGVALRLPPQSKATLSADALPRGKVSRGEQTRTDIVVSKPGMKSHGEPDSIGDLIRRRYPRRLFVVAGERRRRALNLQFASPPVATRNELAPPARIGAPEMNAPIGTIRAYVRREGAFPSPRTPAMQRKCENRSKPRSFLVC